MKNNTKLELANLVLAFVAQQSESGGEIIPVCIGTLNKVQGFNGFKKAEVGTPVFEKGDKYLLYLESLDGKTNVVVPYNKETLGRVINFTSELAVIHE